MYCSGCGQPIAPNQSVCTNCGKPVVQPMPVGYLLYSRVQRHVLTLAILWLAYSLLAVLAFLVAIPFLGFIFGHGGHGFGGPPGFPFPMAFHWMLPMITIAVYLRAALGALVGIGLLRRERWARLLAIVVSILTLIKFPIGTALSIYTLWVLVPARSAMEYDTVAEP
jgi:hypothetical protein